MKASVAFGPFGRRTSFDDDGRFIFPTFRSLAQLYYPDHDYQGALRLFRREMHETRGMWQAMQAVGYKDYTKVLTRAQVKVIVKFLDPPI